MQPDFELQKCYGFSSTNSNLSDFHFLCLRAQVIVWPSREGLTSETAQDCDPCETEIFTRGLGLVAEVHETSLD